MISLPQLTLDFAHTESYAPGDFLVSDANRDAWEWVNRWPEWPSPGLCLWGPMGSGKTHLAHVWAAKSGARFVPLESLADTARTPPAAVVVEGLHRLNHHEESLFHLYNILRERGGALLLTSCFPPARLEFLLHDLASRLRSLPAVALREPDDALLAAVLAKRFRDRQLAVGDDVIAYLLPRIERSFAAARAMADRLDTYALSHGRALTVPLARRWLEIQAELDV